MGEEVAAAAVVGLKAVEAAGVEAGPKAEAVAGVVLVVEAAALAE